MFDDLNLLQLYINDGDAFCVWAGKNPALAQQVNLFLLLVQRGRDGCPTDLDWLRIREAANQLQMLASEVGFVDAAAVFSLDYDRACRALLPYWTER